MTVKDIKMRDDRQPERCFVLKDDIGATVVIPFRSLLPIDYQRLKRIEAKGGEMLRAMRDDTLDNGRNALKQYEPLFEIIYKKAPESIDPADQKIHVPESAKKNEEEEKSESKKKSSSKRGPGRPRGSKNKREEEDSGESDDDNGSDDES